MTRNLILLFLTAIISSCGRNYQHAGADHFVVEKFSIPFDTRIGTTIFYKEHYYCLADNRKFVCFTPQLQIDSAITNSIGDHQFVNAFLAGDTLIAISNINDTAVKYYYLSSELKWKVLENPQYRTPLFEDDRFIANTCCFGEFGGSLFFYDKQTKRMYSCPATCATTINKFKDSYYVTITLAHMRGSSEILKIGDPTKLYELTVDSLKNECNWWALLFSEADYMDRKAYEKAKSRLEIGTQKILDTFEVLTLTSFVYNDQLYHINSDRTKTFISKVVEGRLLLVDSIFNQQLASMDPLPQKYGPMQLIPFSFETSGFLTIRSDTISIITFDVGKHK